MSNRPQLPDDEPVIGFAPQTSATGLADPPMIGDSQTGEDHFAPDEAQDDEYYPEDELEPYYREYERESPAQSPWFYAFLVAAGLIGAALVFVIVRSIDTGGEEEPAAAAAAQILQVQLTAPREGDRFVAGDDARFAAQAASSEPISKVELLIDGEVFAEGSATEAETQSQGTATAQAKLYDAVVTASFTERGEHLASLRITAGDESRETEAVRILVVSAPEDPRVETRVIATTAVRTGPGDSFPESERLEPGATVLVVARTEDSEWLMIDDDAAGEHWIRRNAVQDNPALVSLPVRTDVADEPTQTATPEPGETPAPTPSGGPDFTPVDARFVYAEGGRGVLRVSVVNNGSSFSGSLTVQAAISSGSLVQSQIVLDLSLPPGGGATLNFEVAGSLPSQANATVIVDPGNAISESIEDNNTAHFPGLSSPAGPPELIITSVEVSDGSVTVVVTNLGGQLPPGEIAVVLTVGGVQEIQSTNTGLATDESVTFTLTAPGTGTGTVSVVINGATAQSVSVDIPPEATTTASATTTETATEATTASQAT